MAIEGDLAMEVLTSHPLEAARVLERLPAEEAARFLASASPTSAAKALAAMHGPALSQVLTALSLEDAAEVVAEWPLDIASASLRRLSSAQREEIASRLPARSARALRSLLRFQPHTAGALMDPAVLALPVDLEVAEAMTRVRESGGEARYNIYAVDRDQRLVGVFNLRELFLAPPRALLSTIAHPNPHRLAADADRRAILSHPGWREVHALPVVDRDGVYLGAIRYRTLRRLEDELRGGASSAGATAQALGDLFRTGASSLLEAIATSTPAAADPGGPGDAA